MLLGMATCVCVCSVHVHVHVDVRMHHIRGFFAEPPICHIIRLFHHIAQRLTSTNHHSLTPPSPPRHRRRPLPFPFPRLSFPFPDLRSLLRLR